MLKYFLIFLSISLIKSEFQCEDITESEKVLNTLNGRIKGECRDLPVYFSDKAKTKSYPLMEWYSVPYGEPPVGKLRLNKPLSVKSWSEIKDGTEFPSSCIKPKEKDDQNDDNSEDCLYLNIYSPYNSYKKSVIQNDKSYLLPIFVWIHGGSYYEGTSSEYDTSTVTAVGNIVSVVINYRLGGLGHLYLSNTNATGNLFLYDQSLALKWIYENADKFGGDRNRITISGESAGSTSVAYHLLLKRSWPYYKNAILQSGNPYIDFGDHHTPDEATQITKDIAKQLGCNIAGTNQQILECLQSKDPYYLNDVTLKKNILPLMVYDKDFIVEQPYFLFKRGDFKKDVNIFHGYTDYEHLSLAYSEIEQEIPKLENGDYATFKQLIKSLIGLNEVNFSKVLDFYSVDNSQSDYFYDYVVIMSDWDYICPTHLFAEAVAKTNKNIYLYKYAYRSSTSSYASVFDGAAHADELEMMFGTPIDSESDYDSDEKLFSEQMVNYWTNFVNYDKPSLNNEWLRYTDTNSSINRNLFYLKKNQNKNTIFKTNDRICEFWSSLGVYNYN